MKNAVNLVMVLCFSGSVIATRCVPEYCQITENSDPALGFPCLWTPFQVGGDCAELNFDGFSRNAPEDCATKFLLRAYAYKVGDGKVTAFNFSITDANFHSLVIRYSRSLIKGVSACSRLQLYGNETSPAPMELFNSCPFYSDYIEQMNPFRLDYLVTGETYNYAKRYEFNVPDHRFIGDGVKVKEYELFLYVDVSNSPLLLLHGQPLPESYNVTEYKIWIINDDLNSVVDTHVFSIMSEQDIWANFTADTGNFSFKACAIHPDCGQYGCANSTTPHIYVNTSHRYLLMMIVSTVWIPPVILYVLYHCYKLYRREVLTRRKPNCLLVYTPTRLTHINAMVQLAKYLRSCNVAVVDTIDATNGMENDPEHWCKTAFENADVLLIATSPPPKKPAVSLICRGNDSYLFKFIRENRCQKEKRSYIVQLPYCKPDDVPEELRQLKKFCLPKELPRLLKVIHNIKHTECVSACDKEFLDSVKLAKLEILEEDGNVVKETRETENLLSVESAQTLDNRNPLLNGIISQSFTTNIDELNLLGETGEDGETFVSRNSINDVGVFCINELNL